MRWSLHVLVGLSIAALGLAAGGGLTGRAPAHPSVRTDLAPAPPMGWNSYDAYRGSVTEQEFRANVDFLAQHLAPYGWNYAVIDYYWYFTHTEPNTQQEKWEYHMDKFGRLIPAPNRFPSAAGGSGFKPLADYVHSKGLKFGVHIMRGIPRAAVWQNLPVMGTAVHARDIAITSDAAAWSTAMYGVDVSKPAGQAYYDSIVALYAQWGVDYIKADDMCGGVKSGQLYYHAAEVAALHRAIARSGRAMVLSLSGAAPLSAAADLEKNAQLWRISSDFWDNWPALRGQFALCRAWAPYIGPDHWPDADMLPIGRIRVQGFADPGRWSRLTPDEAQTLLTLWVIFRSPLMMGGELPTLDAATLARLTNREVLAVDQESSHNRELIAHGNQVVWAADGPAGSIYLAVFSSG